MLCILIRLIIQTDFIFINHIFCLVDHISFASAVNIIQGKCTSFQIHKQVGSHIPEDTFAVRMDLIRTDRDPLFLFAFLDGIAGRIPSALARQPFGMQDSDLSTVYRRILIDLRAFYTHLAECSVCRFLQVGHVNRIRIVLQPRIGIKRMVSRGKILKIKCIQMSADCLEFIPDS